MFKWIRRFFYPRQQAVVGTVISDDWCNQVQTEMVALISAVGDGSPHQRPSSAPGDR